LKGKLFRPRYLSFDRNEEDLVLNQNDQESAGSAGTLPAQQPANVQSSNGQTSPGLNMTNIPQQTPKSKRSKTALIIVATVVVVLVIAAVMLMGSTANRSTVGEIKNGGYLAYSANGAGPSGQSITGNLTMTFDNVTSTRYTIEESFNMNGLTFNSSENMTMINGSWVASSSDGSANLTSPVLIGQQTLQTNFGQKTTDHYSETYTGYTYEFWQDNGNQMLYQLKFTYSSGLVITCVLTSTNMT
jgi:hypothetical protein